MGPAVVDQSGGLSGFLAQCERWYLEKRLREIENAIAQAEAWMRRRWRSALEAPIQLILEIRRREGNSSYARAIEIITAYRVVDLDHATEFARRYGVDLRCLRPCLTRSHRTYYWRRDVLAAASARRKRCARCGTRIRSAPSKRFCSADCARLSHWKNHPQREERLCLAQGREALLQLRQWSMGRVSREALRLPNEGSTLREILETS